MSYCSTSVGYIHGSISFLEKDNSAEFELKEVGSRSVETSDVVATLSEFSLGPELAAERL